MKNSRRSFIKKSSTGALGLSLLHVLESCATDVVTERPIDLEIYATDWGYAGTKEAFFADAAAVGYDGVEVWVPQDDKEADQLEGLADEYNLKLGLLAGNQGDTVESHLDYFKQSIAKALRLEPAFINCHAGKDYFTFDQNKGFIEHTIEESERSKTPIYHETHRGRILFCTPVAIEFLQAYESFDVTLDISHWCCVHESLLQDQAAVIDQVLERTGHIHSRVGFAEAPQIPDPSDPQFEQAVNAHFAWWDKVVKRKSEANQKLTMTTEFGPKPYMWTHLGSAEPLADVWEINVLMKDLWVKRYGLY